MEGGRGWRVWGGGSGGCVEKSFGGAEEFFPFFVGTWRVFGCYILGQEVGPVHTQVQFECWMLYNSDAPICDGGAFGWVVGRGGGCWCSFSQRWCFSGLGGGRIGWGTGVLVMLVVRTSGLL